MCNPVRMAIDPNPPTQAIPLVRLMGTAEVATTLHMDKSTVTRMVKAGQLPLIGKLAGPKGALVFDATTVESVAEARKAAKA